MRDREPTMMGTMTRKSVAVAKTVLSIFVQMTLGCVLFMAGFVLDAWTSSWMSVLAWVFYLLAAFAFSSAIWTAVCFDDLSSARVGRESRS